MADTEQRIDQLQKRADPHRGKEPWHATPAERVQLLRAVAGRLLCCDDVPNPPWRDDPDDKVFLAGLWAWFLANGETLPDWATRIIGLSFREPKPEPEPANTESPSPLNRGD